MLFCGECRDAVFDAVACVACAGVGGVTVFKPGITLCGLDILHESNEACIDNSLALSMSVPSL